MVSFTIYEPTAECIPDAAWLLYLCVSIKHASLIEKTKKKQKKFSNKTL